MTKTPIENFEEACDELRDAGYSVVAVASRYTKEDAFFSTRLSLTAAPDAGVSEDHVVLDALREISHEWSEVRHAK